MAYVITRARALALAAFTGLTIAAFIPAGGALAAPRAATTTASPSSAAAITKGQAVVNAARSHLGARFVLGTTGPYTFDCSGLVYRSFVEAGVVSAIGGTRKTAAGYYSWFRARGWTSTTGGQVGDVVVYGYSGVVSHSGIYIGGGNVISALVSGVKIHPLHAVTKPFIAFLHTHLSGTAPAVSAPAPTPPPPPPASSGTHTLAVNSGTHYTYSISGSRVVGRRLLTISGGTAKYRSTGITDYIGLNGKPVSMVRLTSGPFAGRYMRPYETGNRLY